jgi:hypothetical protein
MNYWLSFYIATSYGEADEVNTLSVRLSISFVIDGVLNYIFRFVTFHIFERVSDNMDSVIVISDQLAASVTVVSHIL